MTFDLSKGHVRSLGVGGGINKTAALVAATVSAAVIAGIWASVLRVDPARVGEPLHIWGWLLLQAFPVTALIVGVFLAPLYVIVLRPAGQTDPTIPIFAVFGAGTAAMIAGLVLVSAPGALRDYDVFKIEDGYVRATQAEIRTLEPTLIKAGAVPLFAPANTVDADPLAESAWRVARFNAEIEKRALAFDRRKLKVRLDLANRLGASQAGRDRLLMFDRQAAMGDRTVEKFWTLQAEYGRLSSLSLDLLRKNPDSWRMTERGPALVWGRTPEAFEKVRYDLWRAERDLGRVYDSLQEQPFVDRKVH